MKKYKVNGNCVEMWINGYQYYTTNNSGDGMFFVDLSKNDRRQLAGTCDFTVRHCKTDEGKKAKMRRYLQYEE